MPTFPRALPRTGEPDNRPRIALIGLVSLVIVGLGGGLLPAAATPPVVPKQPSAPTLHWRSCGADLPDFQCATAAVPLDYSKPQGRRITLALTRLPAAKPKERIGSLFTNPGGPGGSGVDFVQGGAQVLYSQDVLDRFDIIGFDPRGVARSTPVTCYDSQRQEESALAGTVEFPGSAGDQARFDRESEALARNCVTRSAELMRHSSTANVARDLDLLRRAVGDNKLNYAGYSYGTYLGATYAKLFPTRIRAMVLDGPMDPVKYNGSPASTQPVGTRIDQDLGGSEVFQQFLRYCTAAGPTLCSLRGLGDPVQITRSVFTMLKASPARLVDPSLGTETVTYQSLVSDSYQSLYSPESWSDLADLFTLLAKTKGGRQKVPGRVPPGVRKILAAGPQAAAGYASLGGALASSCVDAAVPPRQSYPSAATAADRRYPEFGSYRAWVGYPCTYLRALGITDDAAYTGGWQQTTSTPVLVLADRHDPATPYLNARPFAARFPRASLVTVEGWGHLALGQSRCADARVASYLLNPGATVADATCPTDITPFSDKNPFLERSLARESLTGR